jgi:hypothetical protein
MMRAQRTHEARPTPAPATAFPTAAEHDDRPASGSTWLAGRPWDLSTVPVRSTRPARPVPRIEWSSLSLRPVAPAAPARDGSPDDAPVMLDDQDALAPDVFERGRTGRGVHIRVSGGNPGGTTEYPQGIRWVQTIETDRPLHNQTSPYVDFIPPRDDKPFYFSDAGETATFSDNPSRSANGIRWDATLSLVGVKDKVITRFDSVKYGFDIDGSGTVNLHGPSSVGVASLVVHGDTLRSEHGDWAFSGGFTVPQVPAGGGDVG